VFSLLYLRAVEEGKKYIYVFEYHGWRVSLGVAMELTKIQIHIFWNMTVWHFVGSRYLCVLRGISQVLEAEDS